MEWPCHYNTENTPLAYVAKLGLTTSTNNGSGPLITVLRRLTCSLLNLFILISVRENSYIVAAQNAPRSTHHTSPMKTIITCVPRLRQ
jgi:hypothetical protein